MEEKVYYNNLYDYYGELLTKKQQQYFEDYYFNDFSLSEISENYNISRNAVYKQLQNTIIKLNEYEEKLQLLSKKRKILITLEKIDDINIVEEIKNNI